jgi:hypothetical protein
LTVDGYAEEAEEGKSGDVEEAVEDGGAESAGERVAEALEVPGFQEVARLAGGEGARGQADGVDGPGVGPGEGHLHVGAKDTPAGGFDDQEGDV